MSLLDALSDDAAPKGDADQFAVIIPAAGDSSRFQGFPQKKPFVELNGRAIWLRTVEHFVGREDVSEVVVVIASEDMEWFREKYRPNLAFMNLVITEGGATRADSVRHGLQALTRPATYVAVHDAARPLLTKKWITEIFAAAKQHKAVIPGTRVRSTVKAVDDSNLIQRTVDRTHLMLAQTPQVFNREMIEQAYERVDDAAGFTDEASLVEAAGHPVYVHETSPMNIKITTREDFEMAQALLEALPDDGGLLGAL